PRDNVIFELGLFMGKLGRFRTFLVYNEDEDIKIPSDLAGVTHATFRRRETDRNIRAQVSPACTKIEDAIRQQGGKEGAAEIIRDPEPNPAIARATVSTMKKIELSEQAQWVFNTLVYYQRKFVGDSDQTGAWWMYFIHPSAPQFKFFLTGVAELLNKDLAAVPADSEKVQVHLTWEGVRYSRTPGAYDENNRYMFEGIQDKPFEEPTASGS
ncbi:MAG: nucleotide-binding protein, partial [Planctomycetes bacterium]|nr:nucleotide-binding protein [Planctomycetota bacterium]